TFANVVGARAIDVAAVPAKLFLGSLVRLAPKLAACGLAVLFEVGQVGHAPASPHCSTTRTPCAVAIVWASASAPSREACGDPQVRQRTSQPPSPVGTTRTGWIGNRRTARPP